MRCPKCGHSEDDAQVIHFYDGMWFRGLPVERQPYRDSIRTVVISKPTLWSRIKRVLGLA